VLSVLWSGTLFPGGVARSLGDLPPVIRLCGLRSRTRALAGVASSVGEMYLVFVCVLVPRVPISLSVLLPSICPSNFVCICLLPPPFPLRLVRPPPSRILLEFAIPVLRGERVCVCDFLQALVLCSPSHVPQVSPCSPGRVHSHSGPTSCISCIVSVPVLASTGRPSHLLCRGLLLCIYWLRWHYLSRGWHARQG
jgi:hypothetical protein